MTHVFIIDRQVHDRAQRFEQREMENIEMANPIFR